MSSTFSNFGSAKVGDRDIAFDLDLAGFAPFQASGHLDAGNYEFEIDDWYVTAKKAGGLNTRLVAHSVSPEGYAGVPSVRDMPAPNPQEPGGGVGGNMTTTIAWGIYEHGFTGKSGNPVGLDDIQKPDANGKTARTHKLSWFKGKRFYASVKDDSYTNDKGETVVGTKQDRIISTAEFKAAPGPSSKTSTGVSQGRVSPSQERIPEVGAKAGNGSAPARSVDQMLGTEPAAGGADAEVPF